MVDKPSNVRLGKTEGLQVGWFQNSEMFSFKSTNFNSVLKSWLEMNDFYQQFLKVPDF